jgi:4-alpha-glucanotransferase
MKKDGYTWWRSRMEFMLEIFDGVRIDHFRGFEAFYSIPAGEKTAKNGKWVKGPGIDLINAIKPLCEGRMIIAEDLGDITPEVEKLVADSGFTGMRVLQFGFLSEDDCPHTPHNYPSNCVAYTGTHDNNTLLGFVWELDGGSRRRVFDYCGYRGDDLDESYDYLLHIEKDPIFPCRMRRHCRISSLRQFPGFPKALRSLLRKSAPSVLQKE